MNSSFILRLSDNYPFSEEDNDHWNVDNWDNLLLELKMLFNSRSRSNDIEDVEYVNSSVLNYGFNESFSDVLEVGARRRVLEQRLINTLSRFEPRLDKVSLKSIEEPNDSILFRVSAYYKNTPVMIELTWDDCIGRFYFNE